MPASLATLRATRMPAVCTSLTTTRRCLLPPVSSRTRLPLPLCSLVQRRLLPPPLLPPQQQPQLEQLRENEATSLPAELLTALPAVLLLLLPPSAAAYARRSWRPGSERTLVIAP